MDTMYSSAFYDNQSPTSKNSAEEVLKIVFDTIGTPSSALDVGCGVATWSATMLEMKVKDVLAVDGEYVSRDQLQISEDIFLPVDLESECLTDRIKQRFDFLCCVEVAEHLSEKRADSFVRELALLSDNILFSAAIPHQGGLNHVNEQWQSYWVNLFAEHGYFPRDFVRKSIWNNDRVCFWYRQNVVFFSKVNTGERSIFDVVHPELWKLKMCQPLPEGLLTKTLKSFRNDGMRGTIHKIFKRLRTGVMT